MLAAFWALVPGALSFESVSQVAEGRGSIAALAITGSAVLSIALGTLVGWSIYQAVEGRLPRPMSQVGQVVPACAVPGPPSYRCSARCARRVR